MTSRERRRKRRLYRTSARELIRGGIFLNGRAPVGSTPWNVAQWFRNLARAL